MYTGLRNSGAINWSKVGVAITQEPTLFHESYQSVKYSDTLLNQRSELDNYNSIKPGIKYENIISNYLR